MLEAMFGAVWFRSPEVIKSWLSRMALYVCDELDAFTTGRTNGTRIAAGKAIAATRMLNIERALGEDRPMLPNALSATLGPFTKEEWKEVLVIAESAMDFMTGHLENPRWSHLRRTPS
jgi:hypothetical protein